MPGPEGACEMGLIGKAAGGGDLGEAELRVGHHRPGGLEPQRHQPFLRRFSAAGAEAPGEPAFRQPRHLGQFGAGDATVQRRAGVSLEPLEQVRRQATALAARA